MGINVINPSGELVSIPESQVSQALQAGYQQASPEDIQKFKNEKEFGTTSQQIVTGLEGAGSAATFGLSTGLEKMAGVNPEDIQARRETNPISHGIGQVAGLAATSFIPGLGEAELGAEAAGAAAKAINPFSAQSVMSGLGEKAAASMGFAPEAMTGVASKFAVENALFQSGDEISKMLSNDPHQSIETAAANVGLAGLIGGGLGAAVGSISPLWKANAEGKAGRFISDAKNRLLEHLDNPDRLPSMAEELTHRINSSDEIFDEAYGAKGIKAEAISKLLPNQLSDHMVGMAQDTIQISNNLIKEMRAEPDLFPRGLAAKFEKEARVLSESLSEIKAPEQVFNSLQRFKQALQEQMPKRWESVPLEAKDYLKNAGSVAKELKIGLEDPEIWGKAGEVQQEINKAFSNWLPWKKQFEGKFMDKIGEDRQLSIGKLQTFLNQTGKAAQDSKQKILGGFLKADEAYRGAIESAYEKIGQPSPFKEAPLNYSNAELRQLTPGQKFADVFLKKGLGKVIGGGAGAAAGSLVGHPFLGLIAGEHAITPLIDSVLPSIIKPLLQREASGAGAKSAIDLGMAAVKGQRMMEKATKAVFKAGQEVVPSEIISEKDQKRLEASLARLRDNPTDLLNSNSSVAHYLPDHAAAIGQSSMNAINILNQAKPKTTQGEPLDDPIEPTQQQKDDYLRNLTIAQIPLSVLAHAKNGTIRASDVQMLKGLYPRLYNKLSAELVGAMLNHKAAGEKIPYRTKMGISIFLGQPMDSTLTPMGIQMRQVANKTNLAPSQQETMVKPKPSSPALGKMSQNSMTSGQSAESRHLK